MIGHRHITTTERYLHYAPDADASAKLTELWGDRSARDGATPPSTSANVVALPEASRGALGEGAGRMARPLFVTRQDHRFGRVLGE